ncbi:MAG: hypothetical protein Nkreftii_000692 [Candidatus Nitrospira kreftii]|uniref:Uncharacterized protein n=1 Tax=Candidatus Nitrospira kreftii TaxID=2652173 RepID=A0A7S8FBQ1_9BACT|nr:MAG: hypothetical protein Nkreftii_000692 [Candidatus Nitrospira kreftii]
MADWGHGISDDSLSSGTSPLRFACAYDQNLFYPPRRIYADRGLALPQLFATLIRQRPYGT